MYIPDPYVFNNPDRVARFIAENSYATLVLANNKETHDIRDAQSEDERRKGPRVKLPKKRRILARGLPFELDLDSNHYNDGRHFETLSAHCAKHYPIYNCFKDGDEALLIFQGPHSYVSPSWYDSVEAATWNYVTVHVYGTIERPDEKPSTEAGAPLCPAEREVKKWETLVKEHSSPLYKQALARAERDLKQIKGGEAPHLERLLRAQLYKYEQRFGCNPKMSIDRLGERFEYLRKYIAAIRVKVTNFEVNVQGARKLSQDQNEWSIQNIKAQLEASGYPGSVAIAQEMGSPGDREPTRRRVCCQKESE